jgi:hypothetical protein
MLIKSRNIAIIFKNVTLSPKRADGCTHRMELDALRKAGPVCVERQGSRYKVDGLFIDRTDPPTHRVGVRKHEIPSLPPVVMKVGRWGVVLPKKCWWQSLAIPRVAAAYGVTVESADSAHTAFYQNLEDTSSRRSLRGGGSRRTSGVVVARLVVA